MENVIFMAPFAILLVGGYFLGKVMKLTWKDSDETEQEDLPEDNGSTTKSDKTGSC
ncbi:MAG: hypothetical protein V7707_11620 [Motiliproteus sp.]